MSERNIFAVCDLDVDYAYHFMEYLSKKKNIPFEVRVFTSAAGFREYVKEHLLYRVSTIWIICRRYFPWRISRVPRHRSGSVFCSRLLITVIMMWSFWISVTVSVSFIKYWNSVPESICRSGQIRFRRRRFISLSTHCRSGRNRWCWIGSERLNFPITAAPKPGSDIWMIWYGVNWVIM